MSKLVADGFNTWDKVLVISEEDLERLDFKLGHRRKLQRKVKCYIYDSLQDNSYCDKELLADDMRNDDCADQLGQSGKQSASSSSSSSFENSGHTIKPSCLASSANTTERVLLPCLYVYIGGFKKATILMIH